MTTGYQINGVDTDILFVRKEYFLENNLWTWGYNNKGQLGINNITNCSSPVQTVASGTNWKIISCGALHTAAIKTDGTLWTCGYNAQGQLGDNTSIDKSSPVQVYGGGTNWKTVSCGGLHTAAIKTDGTLWNWGTNGVGNLGDNTTVSKSSPVQTVAGGSNWKLIACGETVTAAIKTDGTLWTWGGDYYGQLGDNTTTNKSSPIQTVAGGTNWATVTTGNYNIAAIKTDGTLWTWGRNTDGQLGDNTSAHKSSPVQVYGGGIWKQVGFGLKHASAIKTDGTLWSWGSDNYGQVGDNTVIKKSSPVQVYGSGYNWKYTACGQWHTNAIKTDGTLWSWGYNPFGNLGDNTILNKSSPVQTTAGGTNWTSVSCGNYHVMGTVEAPDYSSTVANPPISIAISGSNITYDIGVYTYTVLITFANGSISTDCNLLYWSVELGDSSIISVSSAYVTVNHPSYGPRIIKALDPISNARGILNVTINTTLWAWGRNTEGWIGDNTLVNRSSPVQTITGGSNWVTASRGFQHSAAIKTDGTLWLWGDNAQYALGIGNTLAGATSPVQVYGGGNWKSVSCGYRCTAAIKTDGTLWTWGRNDYGQLGSYTIQSSYSPAQTLAGGSNWSQVSTMSNAMAAIKTDGTLWMWGDNSTGQLGDNTSISKSSPVQVYGGGTNWMQVMCGEAHTAAIKSDGTLWTWGWNNYGQLGSPTTGDRRSSPVQTTAGGTNWKQVSCYLWYTAAVKTDGTLWMWGYDNYYNLGNGSSTTISNPTQTISGSYWKSVACGRNHCAAIKTDGTLWLWGTNTQGQIGNNTNTIASYPVQVYGGGTTWSLVTCGYAGTIALKQ